MSESAVDQRGRNGDDGTGQGPNKFPGKSTEIAAGIELGMRERDGLKEDSQVSHLYGWVDGGGID